MPFLSIQLIVQVVIPVLTGVFRSLDIIIRLQKDFSGLLSPSTMMDYIIKNVCTALTQNA